MEETKKEEEVVTLLKEEAEAPKRPGRPKKEVAKEEVVEVEAPAAKEDGVLISKETAEEIRDLLFKTLKTSNNIPFRKQLKRLLKELG